MHMQATIRDKQKAITDAEYKLKDLDKKSGEDLQKAKDALAVKEAEITALNSQLEALSKDLPEGQRPKTEAGGTWDQRWGKGSLSVAYATCFRRPWCLFL
jgi:chromosome segregation ATPase